MGQFNDGFLPAAILLRNPGLTIQELATELNNHKISDNYNLGLAGKVELHYLGISSVNHTIYHQGEFGTLKSLGLLNNNENFFGNSGSNPYERFHVVLENENGIWQNPSYAKVNHIYDKIGESWEKTMPSYNEIQKGDLLQNLMGEFPKYYLNQDGILKSFLCKNGDGLNQFHKVEEASEIKYKKVKRIIDDGFDKISNQTIKARPIYPVFEIERFENLESLVSHYPEINLENFYDKEQRSGVFRSAHTNNFREEGYPKWKMKDGKYYLDVNDLYKNNMEHTYTSIVLTAEALKSKVWDVLEYQSGDEYPYIHTKFLLENPDSHKRYLESINNWHLNKMFRLGKMTELEVMQYKKNTPGVNLEFERKVLEEKYPRYKKLYDWRQIVMGRAESKTDTESGDEEILF